MISKLMKSLRISWIALTICLASLFLDPSYRWWILGPSLLVYCARWRSIELERGVSNAAFVIHRFAVVFACILILFLAFIELKLGKNAGELRTIAMVGAALLIGTILIGDVILVKRLRAK